MPACPDLRDPILKDPEVLPVPPGRSHPELADNEIGERNGAEGDKILSEHGNNLADIADVRACPLHPDIECHVRAEYHEVRGKSRGTRYFSNSSEFLRNCPCLPDRLPRRSSPGHGPPLSESSSSVHCRGTLSGISAGLPGFLGMFFFMFFSLLVAGPVNIPDESSRCMCFYYEIEKPENGEIIWLF